MKILYQAEDGTIFENEYACEDYENSLIHIHLYSIELFDENTCSYSFDKEHITDDDFYNHSEIIIIHDEDELKDFQWVTEYNGWCEWEDIDEPGLWKRISPEETYGDAEWKKGSNV